MDFQDSVRGSGRIRADVPSRSSVRVARMVASFAMQVDSVCTRTRAQVNRLSRVRSRTPQGRGHGPVSVHSGGGGRESGCVTASCGEIFGSLEGDEYGCSRAYCQGMDDPCLGAHAHALMFEVAHSDQPGWEATLTALVEDGVSICSGVNVIPMFDRHLGRVGRS